MRAKLIRITTVSISLNTLLKGQLAFLNRYYDLIGVASGKEKELQEISRREGVRVINVPMSRNIKLCKDIVSLFTLIVLFVKEQPYIVHANTPKASLLSMVAGWITRVPHRIYTVTGLRFETSTGRLRKILIMMEKITCRCATKIIPEGEGVKKILIREKITNKQLNVVLNGNINGVDIEYYNRTTVLKEQAERIRKDGTFTYCFVGRLVKDKGMNELIHAFVRLNSLYSNTYLILVGALEKELDPILPDVEKSISEHHSISHVGFQNDIRPYLIASNVLVFPSYREGFPNVVLQAGAMGLPSIVTNINGCNEIIDDGVNGKIIPSKDEEALFLAMKYFYENRDGEVLEMAMNARSVIVERFEQKKVWEALLKEYQSLK